MTRHSTNKQGDSLSPQEPSTSPLLPSPTTPIVPFLLHHMSKSTYLTWVEDHIPSGRLRLFQSDFLEALSVTPFWCVPLFWIPVAMYLLSWSFMDSSSLSMMSLDSLSSSSLSSSSSSLLFPPLTSTMQVPVLDSLLPLPQQPPPPTVEDSTSILASSPFILFCISFPHRLSIFLSTVLNITLPVFILSSIVVQFILGVLWWSLCEYTLHRFVFHDLIEQGYLPDKGFALVLAFLLHGCHHKCPHDTLRLVMPFSISIPLTLCLWSMFRTFVFTPSTTPLHVFAAMFAGGIFGYVCYDLIHYSTHHLKLPHTLFMRGGGDGGGGIPHHILDPAFSFVSSCFNKLKYRHARHHIEHCNTYGVSSPLWDIIFNTSAKGEVLRAGGEGERENGGGGRGR